MTEKYLLYIDILGFSELVASDVARVHDLYGVIERLNVHGHYGFKTIVFSDTILIYNTVDPDTDDDRAYLVMYACEFAQNLLYRLAGRDLFFRAVLDYGAFFHERRENFDCFFGTALIRSYRLEEELPGLGLFITDRCKAHNRYFPMRRFRDRVDYVFLTQSMQTLQGHTRGELPANPMFVDCSHDYMLRELAFVASIFRNMREHPDPAVRAKHLAAYDLYRQEYPKLLQSLEEGAFAPEVICPSVDWAPQKRMFEESLKRRPPDATAAEPGRT